MVFIQAQGRFQDLEKQNKKQVAYWGGGGRKNLNQKNVEKNMLGTNFRLMVWHEKWCLTTDWDLFKKFL